MSDELIRKHDAHLTRLTLNRPQKANALSAVLVEALLDAVEYAHGDGTRLLILGGAGEHFCAGFDFSGFHEQSEGDLALRFIRIETLLQMVHHAPFETLALAHRVGADHARAILSESRTFGADEALKLSFITAIADTQDWPGIIQQTLAHAEQLTPAAAAALHRQTTPDTRGDDMAALARSVSAPRLKERIRLYREKNSSRERKS